jgi:hypothetical protein
MAIYLNFLGRIVFCLRNLLFQYILAAEQESMVCQFILLSISLRSSPDMDWDPVWIGILFKKAMTYSVKNMD